MVLPGRHHKLHDVNACTNESRVKLKDAEAASIFPGHRLRSSCPRDWPLGQPFAWSPNSLTTFGFIPVSDEPSGVRCESVRLVRSVGSRPSVSCQRLRRQIPAPERTAGRLQSSRVRRNQGATMCEHQSRHPGPASPVSRCGTVATLPSGLRLRFQFDQLSA